MKFLDLEDVTSRLPHIVVELVPRSQGGEPGAGDLGKGVKVQPIESDGDPIDDEAKADQKEKGKVKKDKGSSTVQEILIEFCHNGTKWIILNWR